MIEVIETGGQSTFRTLRDAQHHQRNPRFDGQGFVTAWSRYVGAVSRAPTGELVLCWSTEGPNPVQRETLRQRLEANPGNVSEVLAQVDARARVFDCMLTGEARRLA